MALVRQPVVECDDLTRPIFIVALTALKDNLWCDEAVGFLDTIPGERLRSFRALFGKALIKSECLGIPLDEESLDSMVMVRSAEAFDSGAHRATGYVTAMIRAIAEEHIHGEPRPHVEEALVEACIRADLLDLLVDATPREHALSWNYKIRIDAVGLLQVVRTTIPSRELSSVQRECLDRLIAGLRKCSSPGCTGPGVTEYLESLFQEITGAGASID